MESGGLKLPRHWLMRALQLETDRERSPSELVREAVSAFRDALEESWTPAASPEEARGRLELYAARLQRSRPSSPAIAERLARCAAALHQGREPALAEAAAILAEGAGRLAGFVEAAEKLLRPGSRVLTCGCDETVCGVLRHYADRIERVTVCAFFNLPEAVRHATELAEPALPVRLIPLSHLELFAGEWDLALVPAERVLPDGDVVAPAGTAVLARVAAAHRLSLYAVAERARWAAEGSEHARFSPERRSPSELFPEIPQGVEVVNVAFDRTPAALLTGYLTEAGVLSPGSRPTSPVTPRP